MLVGTFGIDQNQPEEFKQDQIDSKEYVSMADVKLRNDGELQALLKQGGLKRNTYTPQQSRPGQSSQVLNEKITIGKFGSPSKPAQMFLNDHTSKKPPTTNSSRLQVPHTEQKSNWKFKGA